MYYYGLRYLSYLGAFIGGFLLLFKNFFTKDGVPLIATLLGITIIILSIALYLVSKHFENQEETNDRLSDIQKFLQKISENICHEEIEENETNVQDVSESITKEDVSNWLKKKR